MVGSEDSEDEGFEVLVDLEGFDGTPPAKPYDEERAPKAASKSFSGFGEKGRFDWLETNTGLVTVLSDFDFEGREGIGAPNPYDEASFPNDASHFLEEKREEDDDEGNKEVVEDDCILFGGGGRFAEETLSEIDVCMMVRIMSYP